MKSRVPFAYAIVAGLCLGLHNLIMIVGEHLSLSLLLCVLLSFVAVTSIGYVLHALFTFCQPVGLGPFKRYVTAMLANIPLAFVTTWFWHEAAVLPMAVAAPLASVCMVALNFVLGRWAIVVPASRGVAPR